MVTLNIRQGSPIGFGGILKRLILYFWSINLWIQEITIPIMDMGHLDINMGIWIGIIMTHNGYIP